MDFDKILKEKQQKLEELRKQRLEKQQELASQLSLVKETHAIDTPQTITPDPVDSQNENIELSTDGNHSQSAIEVFQIPPPPPLDPIASFDESSSLAIDIDEVHEYRQEEMISRMKIDVERQIRQELEAKYRNEYTKALENLSELKKPSQSEVDIGNIHSEKKLVYPTTKVKRIIYNAGSDNLLSLHEDYICVWTRDGSTDQFTLTDQWKTLVTMNAAIIDSKDNDRIIAASELGYIYIHTFSTGLTEISKLQNNPLVDVFETSNTIIVLTISGEYSILASNLIDVLAPATNVFTSTDFTIDQKHIPKHIRITTSLFLDANNVLISMFTGETFLVDLALKKATLIHNSESSLPTVSLSFDAGRVLILGLDHSVNIINLSTATPVTKPYFLPDLAFSAEWLTPSTFVTCSVQNNLELWRVKHDKIVRERNKSCSLADGDDKPPLISKMRVVDASNVVVGDLSGSVYMASLD
jgi:hypothetical protein